MATRTPHTGVALEVLTAANLAKYPKGWLGYVDVAASQTGITGETTLTGSSLSGVVVGADRLLTIEAAAEVAGSDAGDNCRLRCYVDGVSTFTVDLELDTTRQSIQLPRLPLELAAGSHTFHLTMQRMTGSGTVDVGSDGHNLVLIVQDIGPAPA